MSTTTASRTRRPLTGVTLRRGTAYARGIADQVLSIVGGNARTWGAPFVGVYLVELIVRSRTGSVLLIETAEGETPDAAVDELAARIVRELDGPRPDALH